MEFTLSAEETEFAQGCRHQVMCVSVGLDVEGALVEQFLKIAGWPSHSWRVEVLAGCAAWLGS
jgi:hypothetical protein